MIAESLLQKSIESPDFLALSGSRLYGTNREDSDWDYRGFVVPPYHYIIGHKTFNDADVPGNDHKVYSFQRFLELASNGDPVCTEVLFAPKSLLSRLTDVGERVLSMRQAIVSNKIYRRIMGYSYSEFRKAEGVRLEIEGRTITEDDVIAKIRNVFKPDKEVMDGVIEELFSNKKQSKVSHMVKLGAKRKSEFDKFGFGVTSAAHSIRLTYQLTELMKTGSIVFPRPHADYLRNIRLGKYEWGQVKEVFEKSRAEAEKARDNSVLPNDPNYKFLWDEFLDIQKGEVLRQLV